MTEKSDIWFPAKKYGYGWGLPCTWQGWVVILVYVGLVIAAIVIISPAVHMALWLTTMVGLSFLLCLVCWWKGEKPALRWGNKKQH